jgi:hypothetical protein
MFNNPISALIIGTAMIATALILKPCLEGRKCQYDNTKQYRYQFIDNKYYWKEKVFDRETGVVYGLGKNEDGLVYRQDFTKGRLDVKKRKEGYWMSPDDKYDIYGNADYWLYVANKTTAGNNKAEDTSANKAEPVFFGADEEEDTSVNKINTKGFTWDDVESTTPTDTSVNKINTTTASLEAEFEKIYGGNGATEAKTDYSSMSDKELLKPTTPTPSQGPTVPRKAKSPTTFDASTFRFDNEEFGEIEPINTNSKHKGKVEDLPCIEEENAKESLPKGRKIGQKECEEAQNRLIQAVLGDFFP